LEVDMLEWLCAYLTDEVSIRKLCVNLVIILLDMG
jgi:hypothetical protein